MADNATFEAGEGGGGDMGDTRKYLTPPKISFTKNKYFS